jgi:hypothetical protein
MSQETLSSQETEARSKIGRRIVYWALSAVSILGVIAMVVGALKPEAVGTIKDILAMLLPMIAAWVGTVLAFYFSKENYMAAAQSSERMVGMTLDQRLQSISVEAAMLPIAKVDNKFTLAKTPDQVKLKAEFLATTAEKTGQNRILVVDTGEVVKYIIHRSMVDKFVAEKAFAGVKVQDLTLKELIDDPKYQPWITSFGTLARTDRLSAAKAQVDGNEKCSDVVVTEDGQRGSKAIGWITNTMITEKARV